MHHLLLATYYCGQSGRALGCGGAPTRAAFDPHYPYIWGPHQPQSKPCPERSGFYGNHFASPLRPDLDPCRSRCVSPSLALKQGVAYAVHDSPLADLSLAVRALPYHFACRKPAVMEDPDLSCPVSTSLSVGPGHRLKIALSSSLKRRYSHWLPTERRGKSRQWPGRGSGRRARARGWGRGGSCIHVGQRHCGQPGQHCTCICGGSPGWMVTMS